MEQTYDKPVIGKRIDEVTTETLKYIEDRRKGNIVSLKTRWKKFNDVCFFEPNMIYTIAGTSGTGKALYFIQESKLNKYHTLMYL